MADLKIGHVKIDGKGKTKEEVKKEIMEQVNLQLNEMLGGKEVANVPTKLHVRCDEAEDGSGFNSEIESEGPGDKIMQMLVSVVIDVLASISNPDDDNSRKVDPEITLMFINELVERMTYLEEQENGGK